MHILYRVSDVRMMLLECYWWGYYSALSCKVYDVAELFEEDKHEDGVGG